MPLLEEAQDLPVTSRDWSEKVVETVVAHPEAASKAVQQFLRAPSGMREFAAFCASLGLEFSRGLFDSLPQEWWRDVEFLLSSCSGGLEPSVEGLAQLYRLILTEKGIRTQAQESPEDPFHFLSEAGDERLRKFGEEEPSEKIALISAFWDAPRFNQVLSLLSAKKRREVIYHSVKLERLPKEAVKIAARGYAEGLRAWGAVPPAHPQSVLSQAAVSQAEVAPIEAPVLSRKQTMISIRTVEKTTPLIPPSPPPVSAEMPSGATAAKPVASAPQMPTKESPFTPDPWVEQVSAVEIFLSRESPALFRELIGHPEAAGRAGNA